MKKSILVTGANGFIGQRVVKLLTSANYNVKAFVLPGEADSSLFPSTVELIQGDLTDFKKRMKVPVVATALFILLRWFLMEALSWIIKGSPSVAPRTCSWPHSQGQELSWHQVLPFTETTWVRCLVQRRYSLELPKDPTPEQNRPRKA